ncbi:hypothetical protein R69658_08121 [Paraburkholderia aspalathi]|uniref:Ricin B lectin domain-containing protein n=1 Tax=Paraburkholderia aspalathi TaxID=1324617 RepID=A0ABN7ND16_9BURK|nr:RICIN domain-containing protein [Paraburkholderia aspalathi]MBK3824327.1 hypothetical protein [Paraburkholderia aspalathi]MBK3836184.1 hypothetical protein [Paraburkholderia aspalathi]MBK3865949.1 hypothetical protein [Paraburkholderia aspalathi]CAE6870366.1 hypothetical protein R69658_08121 [Paraburkholderia aspalathi]
MFIYQAVLPEGGTFSVTFDRAPDFALAFVNGIRVTSSPLTTVSKGRVNPVTSFPISGAPAGATLQIVCMSFGRTKYGGPQMRADGRGLSQNVYLNGKPLTNWTMTLAPLTPSQLATFPFSATAPSSNRPFLARATLGIGTPKDMYVDMSTWGTGYVFVNGRNLGRYWTAAGPQTRLYCPGVWLARGANEIIVFEFTQGSAGSLSFFGSSNLPYSASAPPPPVTAALNANSPYFIQNVYSGLNLDLMPAIAGATNMYPGVARSSNSKSQIWTVGVGSSGDAIIANASTGLLLGVGNQQPSPGSPVIASLANGSPSQNWKISGGAAGVFNLTSVPSQLMLDVDGETKAPTSIASTGSTSAIVIQTPANPNKQWLFSQEWRFISAFFISGGVYTIKMASGGLMLDAPGGTLGLASASEGTEQHWTLTSPDSLNWVLTNVSNGEALDVAGQGTTSGTPLDVWTPNGGSNQVFQFVSRGNSTYCMVGTQSGLPVGTSSSSGTVAIALSASNGSSIQDWIFTRVG